MRAMRDFTVFTLKIIAACTLAYILGLIAQLFGIATWREIYIPLALVLVHELTSHAEEWGMK